MPEAGLRHLRVKGRGSHYLTGNRAGFGGRQARKYGGRDWDRTSDPYDVNVVLYR
jgi:hypothetical protein